MFLINMRLVCRGVDKETLGGASPNLPTKKTSLKPNLPIKKAFLAFQRRLLLIMYCNYTGKLNIYCKFVDMPNVWGVRHPHAPPKSYAPPCIALPGTKERSEASV